jgi:hypothetical protein
MDEKQTATVPDFIDLNKAFKATWIDVVNVKSSLYEIESRIAILHKNLLEKQIEGSKQDRGDPPAASSLVKRPPDVEPNSSLERDLHAAKKKSRFSKDTSKILKDWLAENSNNPYPK